MARCCTTLSPEMHPCPEAPLPSGGRRQEANRLAYLLLAAELSRGEFAKPFDMGMEGG